MRNKNKNRKIRSFNRASLCQEKINEFFNNLFKDRYVPLKELEVLLRHNSFSRKIVIGIIPNMKKREEIMYILSLLPYDWECDHQIFSLVKK